MKKNYILMALIFCLATMLTLAGCSGKEGSKAEPEATGQNVSSTDSNKDGTKKDDSKKDNTKKDEINVDVQAPYMKYLGRASVKIKTSKGLVIYIDPYEEMWPYTGTDYDEAADVVLITHEHDDHNAIQLIKDVSKATVIRSSDALKDGKYESFQIKDIKVESVAAYNQNHKKEECVGYVLEFDGIKLYHAGDTSKIDEMKGLTAKNLDYALLPIDGVYNMDAAEAMECAKIINAKHNVAIHSSGSDPYSQENVDKFTPQNVLKVKVGEVVALGK